jgi:hypothetical protein
MEPRRPGPIVAPTSRSGSPRATTLAAWALWVGSVVFVVASLITARAGGPDDPVSATVIGVAVLSFATVGAILVSRLPANVIGWLLALGGFGLAVGNGAGGLADYGLTVHPGSVPDAIWFAWLSEWIWAPAFGAVVLLALVYPTGRLLSVRWWPVAVGAILLITILTFGSATGPWPAGIFPVANPLLIAGGAPGSMLDMVGVVAGPIALLVALLAVASLVLRYRRAAGVERAQLKWFAFVTAISVPAFLVTVVLYGNTGVAPIASLVAGLVAFGGLALLPVAIGIAVLRYRLYEIDRIVSRTIAYAVLSAIVGGLFVGLILVFQAMLAPLTQSNDLAVAVSTLIVFALFAPIRRRVQGLVDRRFNRTRYDAERTVAAFAERLRDEVDLEQLRAEILATVAATVEPSSVSLWLRE